MVLPTYLAKEYLEVLNDQQRTLCTDCPNNEQHERWVAGQRIQDAFSKESSQHR